MELETEHIVSTDRQLVEAALTGDGAAFERLLSRYRNELYQFCLQRTGNNHSDAGDIVQETFIKVFLSLDKYDPKYPFGPWLHRIAHNTFIDFTRKRRDNLLSIDSPTGPGSGLHPATTGADPEETMIREQTGRQLDRILDSMSPHYKQMITLRFLHDYSYEEIAEKLGMPLGTVKTQIHRAREQFYRLISRSDSIL